MILSLITGLFPTRLIGTDVLSAPSIVVGLFVYEILVTTQGHLSGIAGALALAILVIPIVVLGGLVLYLWSTR